MQQLDVRAGLTKGTNAIVRTCQCHSVTVTLANGSEWTVPRTTHKYKPKFLNRAVEIQRHQIPLAVNFASTIHRVQGDTVCRVVVDLRAPMFAHGQFYTALTRVRASSDIRFIVPEEHLTVDAEGAPVSFKVKQVVHRILLRFADLPIVRVPL